jgi:pyruvate dehydrogenase E1 component beta subunit
MGVGVDDPKGIFGTTRGAFEQFGGDRVFDTPLSEAALTGMGVGAAMRGFHPLLVHARNDFLLLALDQIVNNAAKWRYMCGGKLKVPLTIRAIIGRGWGQAAQHSQSLQAMFAHVPGLAVIMPSTPADAKGLLMTALSSDCPVICLEHRWLYDKSGPVPEDPYYTPFGVGSVVRRDVIIVAVSHMVLEARRRRGAGRRGIEAESHPRTPGPGRRSSPPSCLTGGLSSIRCTRSARVARAAEELWGCRRPIGRWRCPTSRPRAARARGRVPGRARS